MMQGGLESKESEDACLCEVQESFQMCEIDLIVGPEESWSTCAAKSIVTAFNKVQSLIFLVVDGFQMNFLSY